MNFSQALSELQSGNKVTRPCWSDFDQKVWLKEITFNGFAPTLVQYNYHIHSGNIDKYPGAVMDYDDMTAVDWEIVD